MLGQTRPEGSDIDGVGIVAILQKPSGPELVLQKQFRPPINKVVIEVPAGLVDAGETAAQSAVRELREETGYHGEVVEMSPVMFNGKSMVQVVPCWTIAYDSGYLRPWVLQHKPEHGTRHRGYVTTGEPEPEARA